MAETKSVALEESKTSLSLSEREKLRNIVCSRFPKLRNYPQRFLTDEELHTVQKLNSVCLKSEKELSDIKYTKHSGSSELLLRAQSSFDEANKELTTWCQSLDNCSWVPLEQQMDVFKYPSDVKQMTIPGATTPSGQKVVKPFKAKSVTLEFTVGSTRHLATLTRRGRTQMDEVISSSDGEEYYKRSVTSTREVAAAYFFKALPLDCPIKKIVTYVETDSIRGVADSSSIIHCTSGIRMPACMVSSLGMEIGTFGTSSADAVSPTGKLCEVKVGSITTTAIQLVTTYTF
jgi:hypothetical protein